MSRTLLTAAVLVAISTPSAIGNDLKPLLKTLQAVAPKGAGHPEAVRVSAELAKADASQLPVILEGLDEAGPLPANWIRAAVDAIAERALRNGGKLPAGELERFVLDRRHAPRARRLAYEWLCRVDPSAPQRLVPGMLDDRSLEMRRDAVARLIDEATALNGNDNKEPAKTVFQKAFAAARDPDQIELLAARLRDLGQPVDLPRHFGFLARWKVIGPFENTGGKGFDVAYPPEQKIDPAAACRGKHGAVRWIDYVTKDEYGKVDLNKALVEEKEVVGYATAVFLSDRRQEVEFRAVSYNALKLWLGGRPIAEHNIYHSGAQFDQYICRAVLEPGPNVILVKVCQNAQTQSWARGWGFQLRVCDASGTAVLSADRDR